MLLHEAPSLTLGGPSPFRTWSTSSASRVRPASDGLLGRHKSSTPADWECFKQGLMTTVAAWTAEGSMVL